MIGETVHAVVNWYMANINYGTVAFLMAVESTFLPMPSEIVVPPAAWKAAQGQLNIFLVILAATVGAVGGATFNYLLALWLGRPLAYKLADTRLAHMLFVTREKLEKSEKYFIAHGRSATFIGRLVPGVRHLISLPAGFARMPFGQFLGYTALGACIWNIALALIGYFLFSQKDLLMRSYHIISYTALGIGVLFAAWLTWKAIRARKART